MNSNHSSLNWSTWNLVIINTIALCKQWITRLKESFLQFHFAVRNKHTLSKEMSYHVKSIDCKQYI